MIKCQSMRNMYVATEGDDTNWFPLLSMAMHHVIHAPDGLRVRNQTHENEYGDNLNIHGK